MAKKFEAFLRPSPDKVREVEKELRRLKIQNNVKDFIIDQMKSGRLILHTETPPSDSQYSAPEIYKIHKEYLEVHPEHDLLMSHFSRIVTDVFAPDWFNEDDRKGTDHSFRFFRDRKRDPIKVVPRSKMKKEGTK